MKDEQWYGFASWFWFIPRAAIDMNPKIRTTGKHNKITNNVK